MRYRCTVRFADTSTIISPSMHSAMLAWWFAHGVAEHENEGTNLLRDLQGKAEDSVREATVEGRSATYTVAPETTD